MATCVAIERTEQVVCVTVIPDHLNEAVRAAQQMVELGEKPPKIVVKLKQVTTPSGEIYLFCFSELIFDE